MKLESIADIEKLPSVLDVSEVSVRLIELVEVIRKNGISAIEGSKAINYLISYQGYSSGEEMSLAATKAVIEWTTEAYDGTDNTLIEWHTANVVNMARSEAIEFFSKRLAMDITGFERSEIKECLAEIGVET